MSLLFCGRKHGLDGKADWRNAECLKLIWLLVNPINKLQASNHRSECWGKCVHSNRHGDGLECSRPWTSPGMKSKFMVWSHCHLWGRKWILVIESELQLEHFAVIKCVPGKIISVDSLRLRFILYTLLLRLWESSSSNRYQIFPLAQLEHLEEGNDW